MPYCIDAAVRPAANYLRWKPDFTDWHVIRKLWRWLKLAHLPFAFGRSTRTTTSETQPPASCGTRQKV